MNPLRILIIDDSESDRFMYQRLLRKTTPKGSLHVVEVDNPQRATESLSKDRFDWILCDYRLPGATGPQIVEALRAGDSVNKNTPVVVATGFHTAAIFEEAKKAGANAVYGKDDFSVTLMRQLLREFLPGLMID